MAVFLDKAVVGGIPVGFVFCESLDEHAGISFPEGSKGARPIHAFGTNPEPLCQFVQEITGFLVDAAVRELENVEKHGSVFGDDVHKHFNDMAGPLKRLLGVIEPVSDAGVGLPRIIRNPRKLALSISKTPML